MDVAMKVYVLMQTSYEYEYSGSTWAQAVFATKWEADEFEAEMQKHNPNDSFDVIEYTVGKKEYT